MQEPCRYPIPQSYPQSNRGLLCCMSFASYLTCVACFAVHFVTGYLDAGLTNLPMDVRQLSLSSPV